MRKLVHRLSFTTPVRKCRGVLGSFSVDPFSSTGPRRYQLPGTFYIPEGIPYVGPETKLRDD